MLRTLASALVAALTVTLVGPLTGPAAAAPYDAGLSTPQEDSYYPAKGDPGVDTLHYGLDLTWLRARRVLAGVARIHLRATAADSRFQLDLSSRYDVRGVTVDGRKAGFTHTGNHLVVRRAFAADSRHDVRIVYRGTPGTAKGPASRPDVARLGMRVTRDGQLWTMQEPFGAFTWYPVNDHPSDKALYDVRVSVPGRWVGVSNGRLVSRRQVDGRTVTRWRSSHPMASYLTTLAVGPYRVYRQTGPGGVPLRYWVPRSRPELVKPLQQTPAAMRWLVDKLGRYPFGTAGIVVTPGDSAMETQTMVTLGVRNYDYGNRQVRQIVVHELAHHWYGDTVTPNDWRDLWMNEGMATYQDTRWVVDQGWSTWRSWQRYWADNDQMWRNQYGPPGAYFPDEFASINVYYCTALMWDRLRSKVGTTRFNRLVRAWPQTHPNSNQSRRTLVRWWEARTGRELSAFFRRWLTAEKSPA